MIEMNYYADETMTLCDYMYVDIHVYGVNIYCLYFYLCLSAYATRGPAFISVVCNSYHHTKWKWVLLHNISNRNIMHDYCILVDPIVWFTNYNKNKRMHSASDGVISQKLQNV